MRSQKRQADFLDRRDRIAVARDFSNIRLRDLARARELARSLNVAFDIDHDLNREILLARIRSLSFNLNSALDRALAEIPDRTRDLYDSLGRARSFRSISSARSYYLASSTAHDSARIRVEALKLAVEVAVDKQLVSDRRFARRLAHAANCSRDLTRALDNAFDADHALIDVASHFLRIVEKSIANPSPKSGFTSPPTPARMAIHILHSLMMALPEQARHRYREELCAELLDLAIQRAPRRAQLAYTFRLMIRIWLLRHAARAATSTERERVR